MAIAKSGTTKAAKTSRTAKTAKAVKNTSAARPAAKKVVAKKPVAKKVASKKSVAKKSVGKQPAAKKTVSKKTVTSKHASGKVPARNTTAGKAAKKVAKKLAGSKPESKKMATTSALKPTKAASAKKTMSASSSTRNAVAGNPAPMKSARDAGMQQVAKPIVQPAKKPKSGKSAGKPRRITPEQALANTRALLDAKKEHDRQPQPWQMLDQHAGPVDHGGHQSPEAADKAEQLHEGESRMQAIQGSISSTDRKNQGKRDAR